jgi:hypothetical protein
MGFDGFSRNAALAQLRFEDHQCLRFHAFAKDYNPVQQILGARLARFESDLLRVKFHVTDLALDIFRNFLSEPCV